MKPYAIIDIPLERVSRISKEIYDYVTTNQSDELGWQFLNTAEILSKCPNLLEFFKEQKLLVRDAAITVVVDDTQLPIHIDEPPVIAKINFPVAHTQGWANRWYQIPQEQLAQCPKMLNKFGKEVIDLSGIKQAEILAEIQNMNQPLVFNSSIPHSVVRIEKNIIAPRIVASFTFFNEPLKWLK
jgi:hypothetical protein